MSGHRSVVTRKGQATIPVDIRRLLGLKQGDMIDWIPRNGHIVVERAKSVTELTAGILRQYAEVLPATLEDIDHAIEQAIAEDALDLGDDE
jgi:AbrB family looped-hinge helix DNA binding protein